MLTAFIIFLCVMAYIGIGCSVAMLFVENEIPVVPIESRYWIPYSRSEIGAFIVFWPYAIVLFLLGRGCHYGSLPIQKLFTFLINRIDRNAR